MHVLPIKNKFNEKNNKSIEKEKNAGAYLRNE